MTGAGSFYGRVMSHGAMTAVDEINAAGGVEGYKLELVIEDHKSGDPKAAVAGMQKLININKVAYVLGSYSAPGVSCNPLCVEHHVLWVNGGGVSPLLINKEYLHNTRMTANTQAPFLLKYFWDKGCRKLGTLYWDDPAGRGTEDTITPIWKDLGGTIVASEPADIGLTDYKPFLARIKAAGADCLGLWTWGNDVGYQVMQARKMGFTGLIGGIEHTADAQKIGGKYMEGYLICMDYFDPELEFAWTQKLVKAYKDKWGEDIEFYAANYYENTYLLAELIKRVVVKGGNPLDGAQLEAAIWDNPKFDSVYGGEMELRKDGTIVKPVCIFAVKEGKLSIVEKVGAE